MIAAREDASTLAELVRRSAGEGEVLAIDASGLVRHVRAAAVHDVAAPDAESIVLPELRVDVALVGGLGGASALEVARAASACVRPGGRVVFALATTRPGLKGTAGSLLGMLRRRKPALLEELCEALLIAGLDDITAHEVADSSGSSVVWGTVR